MLGLSGVAEQAFGRTPGAPRTEDRVGALYMEGVWEPKKEIPVDPVEESRAAKETRRGLRGKGCNYSCCEYAGVRAGNRRDEKAAT